LGTGEVSFLSSSKRAGEMVRKSTPAKALISPTYNGRVRIPAMNLPSSMGSYITERSTHNDGSVFMLFVVVVDLANGLNAGVIFVLVSGSGLVLLVPIQNTANEGRNEGDTSFGTSHSLTETEQKSKVAMDLFITLEFTGSLDTLPGRRDLNENAFLGDTNGFVKLDQVSGLYRNTFQVEMVQEEIGTTCKP
jgi:hypothetical protein